MVKEAVMNDELRSMIHDILNLREDYIENNAKNSTYSGVKIVDQKGKSFHFVGDFKLEIIKNEIVCKICTKEVEQT
tara:strand:- start:270 stop:497 length:228 start_codon:yes stop_codon:yes gene_type:complete